MSSRSALDCAGSSVCSCGPGTRSVPHSQLTEPCITFTMSLTPLMSAQNRLDMLEEVLGDDDMDQIPELEYTKLRRRPWVDQPQWLVILGETHTSWAAIDESPTTVRTCDRCKCNGHSTALCQLHVGLPTNSIFGRSKTVGRCSRCKYCKMADKHRYGAKKRQRETNIGGRS